MLKIPFTKIRVYSCVMPDLTAWYRHRTSFSIGVAAVAIIALVGSLRSTKALLISRNLAFHRFYFPFFPKNMSKHIQCALFRGEGESQRLDAADGGNSASGNAPREQVDRDSVEHDSDDYCLIVDDLGCTALEKIMRVPLPSTSNEGFSPQQDPQNEPNDACRNGPIKRFVRLEAGPCSEIQCLPTAQDILNKIQEVRLYQSQYHRADLYPRNWEETKECQAGIIPLKINGSAHTFTVMQFNTLAEGLSSGPNVKTPFHSDKGTNDASTKASKSIYGGFAKIPNPEIVLDFSLRRWRLLEVILSSFENEIGQRPLQDATLLGPDILAMEEVDRFSGFFEPALAKFGYEGLFISKTTAPGVELGWYSDGCALFWKKNVFRLVSEHRRSYRVGKQVFLIAVLRHRPTGRDIIVSVTHLKAQQSEVNEKIRTLQANELVSEVMQVAKNITQSVSASSVGGVPILLIGDFNTEPKGENMTCIPTIVGEDDQNLRKICSFHPAYIYTTNSYTTWKSRGEKTVKRVIDYIFHNCRPAASEMSNNVATGMYCTHTLSIPADDDIESSLLPGFRYPSDHLMIAARFQIESRKPFP